MSKNIIIQEGGIPYQFTAKKLKTDKVGGGTCLWVPEEETILTKKKITEEGTYKASDEGYYGYSEVEVDVTGSGSFKTKNITQNGTYKAEDDGLVGYSKVKVNVKGGNGSADSSGKPRITFDSDGDIEYSPGEIGSSVVGWDEVDGNEYGIGIDSSGKIVKTKVPSDIEITKNPDTVNYNDGDTIDYSGIIVILKSRDSAMFSNADYPNGRVPFSELVFPETVARRGQVGQTSKGHKYTIVGGINEFLAEVAQEENEQPIGNREFYKSYAGYAYAFFMFSDYAGPVLCSSDYDATVYYIKNYTQSTPSVSFVYNGVTYYVNSGYHWNTAALPIIYKTPLPLNAVNPYYESDTILSICYEIVSGGGEHGISIKDVPVQWVSRYDGRTFEDTFEINVNSGSGSGSTDGGGYSDDSGGSSSGGGGGF